tara:strand:+ start:2039 stop:3379 length:1341 start_codon:yes stop_codon:yes gene_type:complete
MAIENNTTSLRGTKQSISLIPKLRFKEFEGDWEEDILKNRINTIDSGWSPQCEEYPALNNEWGVLKTTSVVWEGFNQNANKKLPDNLEPRSGLQVIDNDILITRAGPTSRVGVAVHVNKIHLKLMLSDKIIRLKVNDITSSFFLTVSLGNKKAQKQLVSKSSGLAESQTNISQKILLNTKLSFPNLPEQQKIASFLASVDTKIQQLTTKKQLLENYKKGVMQQLFSQQLRFKPDVIANASEAISNSTNAQTSFPDWEEKRLGEILERTSTGLNPRKNFVLGIGNNNYVTIKNISKGKIDFSTCEKIDNEALKLIIKRSDLSKNDIIMSSIGNIGEAYLLKEEPLDWNINESVFMLRASLSLLPKYLYYIITNDFSKWYFKNNSTGSSFKSIKLGALKLLPVKLPNKLEQEKIANYLSAIDTKIENVQTQIEKTQAFKKGLLQQMFV